MKTMKNLLAMILCLVLLSGCATWIKVMSDENTDTLALGVGYMAYTSLPDTRPAFDVTCALSEINDPTQLMAELKPLMEQVWVGADTALTPYSLLITVSVNTLWSYLESQAAVTDNAVLLKGVVDKLCEGVTLAKK